MGVFSGAAGSGGARCCRSTAPQHGGGAVCGRLLASFAALLGGAVLAANRPPAVSGGFVCDFVPGNGAAPELGRDLNGRRGMDTRRGGGAQLLELRDPGTLRHGVLWTWGICRPG